LYILILAFSDGLKWR